MQDEDRLLCFGKLDEMRSMIPERRRRRAKVRRLPKELTFGGRQVDKATELGGRAMDAGRDLRERAGRWLQAQKGRVSSA